MKVYVIHFRFLVFLFLAQVFFLNNVSAQEFAPLGATWVYQNVRPENTIFPSLIRFTAARDTFLNERVARVIEKELLYFDGSGMWVWEREGEEIVSSTGDSVFVYNEGEYKLIFDFTRETGDMIVVIDQPFDGFLFWKEPYFTKFTHFQYQIDSLSTVVYENDTLIMQYVSYLENPYDSFLQWGFQNSVALAQPPPFLGKILQGVGSLGFDSMLGTTPDISYPADFGIEQLTCYSDSLRTINFSGVDCDSLIASYENQSSVLESETGRIEVFPNPFSSTLNIEIPNTHSSEIFIYDINGSLVEKLNGGKQVYDLSHLKSGTYLLRINSKVHIYKTFKIYKL